MHLSLTSCRVLGALALGLLSCSLAAQQAGDASTGDQTGGNRQILVHYSPFDPADREPVIPGTLKAGIGSKLWLVQFAGQPTENGREAVKSIGAAIYNYMPDHAYVVRMTAPQADVVRSMPQIRWVGYYEPAYRLEHALIAEHLAGGPVPERRYNILMVDKHRDKGALAAKIAQLGGEMVDGHEGGVLFTVDLSGRELLDAARLDEVLYIDRWSAPEEDMDNARIQGGGDYVEAAGGYTGSGVRGHVYEGVEFDHPDFTTPFTPSDSSNTAARHGHCTAGIIFGNGTSHPSARGMAPDAVGFFTNYSGVLGGLSRNQVINNVVNVNNCTFTTASWGASRTTLYTTISADADDIVFDHRIPWTQSQSNAGNQNSRPQAWAKNIISVGAVGHSNNSNAADDSWFAGNGSTGPAADGRMKPDLCAYYDQTWTSDLTGASGYSVNDHYTNFGGTSGATPIVAGHNALAIQMYTDGLFGNSLPASATSANRFANRPLAQTLKALMIVGAEQYTFTALSTDNLRHHQGWGFPDLQKVYDNRDLTLIIPEDEVITQGQTRTYTVDVPAGQAELKACMTFLEPMGNPAAALQIVNNLSLRVTSPSGTVYWGNNGLAAGNYSVAGGAEDSIDSVECVFIENPAAGIWQLEVIGTSIVSDAHVATAATDASFALVCQGGADTSAAAPCNKFSVDQDATSGICNFIPFGQTAPSGLVSVFASNNGGAIGGAIYMDLTVTNSVYLSELDVNTNQGAGAELNLTVYRTALGGTYAGNETNTAVWSPVSHGRGIADAADMPSRMTLDHPILLSPGTYGLAIVAQDFAHRYTNGSNLYNDANVSLTTGTATNSPFTGSVFTPRTGNVELYYKQPTDPWVNSRYQTVFRSADLGGAGPITGLAFAPCGTGSHWNDDLRIRMQHRPAGFALTSSFVANMTSPVEVLALQDYVWHQTGDQWNEIGLQTAFNYDGVSDVVIEIISTGNISTHYSATHRDIEQRLYASGWSGTPPITGSLDSGALKMRAQFGCADASKFGRSCGGLTVDAVGPPTLGTTFGMSYMGADPGSLVFQRLGFDNSVPVYPFNLTAFGLPECYLWHDSIGSALSVASASGAGGFALPIAADPVFIGTRVLGQCLDLNPSAPGGITVSEYIRIMIGLAP